MYVLYGGLTIQLHWVERGRAPPRDPECQRRAARHARRDVHAGATTERHRLHRTGVQDNDGRARPRRAVPPLVPLQRRCRRRRRHGLQQAPGPAETPLLRLA